MGHGYKADIRGFAELYQQDQEGNGTSSSTGEHATKSRALPKWLRALHTHMDVADKRAGE